MRAAESAAAAAGRTLLVLDTVTGSDAERLYARLGWTRVGVVPDYALWPDGRPCDATFFYKRVEAADPPADPHAADARVAAHVAAHYAVPDLGARVLAALHAAGLDPERVTGQDLAPVDQFHTRGVEATRALAALAGLTAADAVVDLGGGLGGPARTLAAEVGCRVTVLDLTAEYVAVGADLTRRAGLAERVTFRHGSALAAPLPDASVDVVWTQHSTMNIADAPALYAEARRLLRPGGRLAMHEILAGDGEPPLHFPVPWARDASISFTRPAAAVWAALAGAGFRERAWRDVTAETLAWVRARAEAAEAAEAARAAGRPPALGLHLLVGAGFGAAFGNLGRNLAEGRVRVVEAVFEAA